MASASELLRFHGDCGFKGNYMNFQSGSNCGALYLIRPKGMLQCNPAPQECWAGGGGSKLQSGGW